MQAGFELFDHTADVGIRVWAPTQAGLIAPATEGLYAVIGELKGKGTARQQNWSLSGDDAAGLLRDYLSEALLLFESEHRIVRLGAVEAFDQRRLAVRAESFEVDSERSVYYREVKAITYHELAIRAVEGGFEARLIVDI